MIEVIDRIPTYPGRVKLIPVAGQADTYDLVRADEPIEPGTPINRALFQSLSDDISALLQQVNDRLFEMSQRARLGDLTVGSVIGLHENGMLVPFIILARDYSNSGRVLVVRKNCVTTDILMNAGETYYENCKTDLWLNNEYFSMLGAAVQGVINVVSIRVGKLNSGYNVTRKVFLLSLNEYQIATSDPIPLGGTLSYFSSADRKISMFDGEPTNHWTRDTDIKSMPQYITTDGLHATADISAFVAGIRPAFTLPETHEVTVLSAS